MTVLDKLPPIPGLGLAFEAYNALGLANSAAWLAGSAIRLAKQLEQL